MAKMAKCGIHSKCFCDTKHDAPQCDDCILVKHRSKLYIFKNGYKLKKCPRCGEYKRLDEFYLTHGRWYSWCKTCGNNYAKEYTKNSRKHYIIGHKENGKKVFVQTNSPTEMIKHVRKYIVEGNEITIEIKRIK